MLMTISFRVGMVFAAMQTGPWKSQTKREELAGNKRSV